MDSQFQNKLFNYEHTPPGEAWDKIAASLNENISHSVSEKLFQYEEEPSPAMWQNIIVGLNNTYIEKAKVVPFYVKYRRPLKYSGAVAIFVFLAVLTSLLVSKKTESGLASQSMANMGTGKKDTPQNSFPPESSFTVQQGEKAKRVPIIGKSKLPRVNQEDSQVSFSFDENFIPRQAERNEIVSSTLAADKYMIYSDDEGNAIRLPKKIFTAFACSTEDLVCKQRLQQLREKFAASAMTTDFNGLLQILKSLQENQ